VLPARAVAEAATAGRGWARGGGEEVSADVAVVAVEAGEAGAAAAGPATVEGAAEGAAGAWEAEEESTEWGTPEGPLATAEWWVVGAVLGAAVLSAEGHTEGSSAAWEGWEGGGRWEGWGGWAGCMAPVRRAEEPETGKARVGSEMDVKGVGGTGLEVEGAGWAEDRWVGRTAAESAVSWEEVRRDMEPKGPAETPGGVLVVAGGAVARTAAVAAEGLEVDDVVEVACKQEGVSSEHGVGRRVMESWSCGVVESWSRGVVAS
jgi:hypothetical protein